MDSPPSQTLFNYLITAFGALLTAIGAVWWGKVAALEKERVNYVTHDDLEKQMEKIAEERRTIAQAQVAQHVENTRRLDRIEDNTQKGLERIEDGMANGLERIHDRIDAFPYRSPQDRTRSTDR
jgi:hypothetical protein